ncbi:MAG: hypothetical protein GY820_23010 [Gammaproteobacteria bacterium]|nr:hypothetical protein [Gammaproteobacteria bacterium]
MRFQIWKTLVIQFALGVIYASIMAFWKSEVVFSAVTGCLAALIPNGYFYWRISKQRENDNAQQWLGYAYRSEFGKWLMTGMIFMLAFTSDHLWDPIILFAGYALIQVSSWFVPFIIKGSYSKDGW